MAEALNLKHDCVDHLNFLHAICEDCGLYVDAYGNTEAQFDYCSFPDCGCDGNRLCMAKNGPSDDSYRCNREGMWQGTDQASKRAVLDLVGMVATRDKK